MKISKTRLREIARNFLAFIDKRKITCTGQLEQLLGERIELERKRPDLIEVSLKPSNNKTQALTISYCIPYRTGRIEGGIPLEVKINQELNYSLVIIKTDSKVRGYEPFKQDYFKNIMQSKKIESADWQDVRAEIAKLAES